MKITVERKAFKDAIDVMTALSSGLVGSVNTDIVMSVTEKGSIILESGDDGKYAKLKIHHSKVGESFEPGEAVISAALLKGMYTSGDEITMEKKKGKVLKFTCGKLSAELGLLDDELINSIRNEIPSKPPKSTHVVSVNELSEAVNHVNFKPAVHSAENDIFVSYENKKITVVMNDSTRGAIAIKACSTEGKLKFALPPSTLVMILNQFVNKYEHAHIGILRSEHGASLQIESGSKELFISTPLSVNDEPEDSVLGMIEQTEANSQRTVAFKANIKDTLEACSAVVSIVAGMDVGTKLEIAIDESSSKISMASSLGKTKHAFPMTKIGKVKKCSVHVSGMYFRELVSMLGNPDNNYKVEVFTDICIISSLDVTEKLGERVQYIMPLIEQ